MIKLSDVYRIGCLGKPHGVKGEIAFSFDDDVFDRQEADFVFVMIDGLLVPFFFEEYRFSSDVVALVKFEGVDTLGKPPTSRGATSTFRALPPTMTPIQCQRRSFLASGSSTRPRAPW